MRVYGRASSFRICTVLSRVICLLALFKITAASEYGIPIEIKLWDTGRTPLAHMVDVTNEFGLKVLAEHNFLNDNNIAFSPYGLMGIMVALYEGVDGESSYQIQRAMQLPWNRNVMRIGFRDIHRTLKTYFVPEEGFLAGLALNNENVTFNDQYKKILRFYGFDLENDQLPTLSPDNNTTNGTTTSTSMMTTVDAGDTTTIAMTAREGTTTPSTKEETTMSVATINPNVETISTDEMSGASTTASPSLAPNAEDSSGSTSITDETTSTSLSEATTQIPSSPDTELTTLASSVTTIAPTTNVDTTIAVAPITTTTGTPPTTVTPTTQNDAETFSESSQTTSALTGEPSTIEINSSSTDVNTVTSSTHEVSSEISSTLETSTMTTSEIMPELTTLSMDVTTVSNSVTEMANESSLETLERRKKSIVDFIFTNPPYMEDYLYYRSFDIGSETAPGDDKMFLANGLKSIQVTYMHYDTVLEYAYLPHLEASALRLPLDSDRYYLLVILPTRGGAPELGRLLGRMARESDLSDVYSVLRPHRVRGIVPSFIVKGHVTLTTDLQKLGVRDVFEPRQRDFTLMTQQAGVYVRSIEQAVSVAIRKYRPDDHKKNRYVTSRKPVVFSATYPFLYFVMDANIHVALMAGKMVDPLNSRIL